MEFSCGFKSEKVVDSKNNLTFSILVFYPTETAEQSIKVGPYIIDVASEASVPEKKFPLVFISHGTGGSPLVYRSLAQYLARRGFIVAAIEHPFNNREDNSLDGTLENLIYRPYHLSVAIDYMLSQNYWNQHLLSQQIAVIGHSMGAYTAVAASGGIPHTKHQMAYDPNCKITSSQEVPVKKDSRIRALILFAPAVGWFYSEGALAEVNVPIYLLSAEKDVVTPEIHTEILKKGISNSQLLTCEVIENAGHFSFLTPFPEMMVKMGFAPALDPDGFDRVKFHESLNERVLEFLSQHLLTRPSA